MLFIFWIIAISDFSKAEVIDINVKIPIKNIAKHILIIVESFIFINLHSGLKKVFKVFWKGFPKIIERFINFLCFLFNSN